MCSLRFIIGLKNPLFQGQPEFSEQPNFDPSDTIRTSTNHFANLQARPKRTLGKVI